MFDLNMVQQLSHADPAMRYEAAQTLGNSNDMRAVEALIAALRDSNAKVQYAALSGLVKLADSRAAHPIVDVLVANPSSRLWELMKLSIGSRLRSGILDMVERGDTTLTGRVLEALDTGPFDEHQQAFFVRMLGRLADTSVIDYLIDRLISDEPTVQVAAAEALGWSGERQAVPSLLLFVSHPHSMLREAVSEALGRLADQRAVEPLIRALQDDDEWVRRAACVSLGQLGDRSAIEPLSASLSDERGIVQDAAFEALRQLSSGSDTELL